MKIPLKSALGKIDVGKPFVVYDHNNQKKKTCHCFQKQM